MSAEYFAGRLRELRESAGLSRAELAERTGLSVGGIAELEQGRRKPTWATAILLCETLGVSPEAFLQRPARRAKSKGGRPPKPK